jgi:hypothetical protein
MSTDVPTLEQQCTHTLHADLFPVPHVLRRYLVDNDPLLPTWQVLLVFLLQLLGYYIFRSANSEKDAFRTNPDSPEVREYAQSPL